MDHLPQPKNSTKPFPPVPYIGSDPQLQDDARFGDIPQQHGLDLTSLEKGDFAQSKEGPSAGPFLQDWLYFGVLKELSAVAGKKAPQSKDFIIGSGVGSSNVTSKTLDAFIKKRVTAVAGFRQEKKAKALAQLNQSLNTASQVTRQLWRANTKDSSKDVLQMEILLSIMVLGSSIDVSLKEVDLVSPTRRWSLAEAAKAFMMRRGWCPRDIDMAEDSLSEVSMFCAAHLNREVDKSADHSRCTKYACEASQVDNENYQTQHVTDGCQCQFWKADLKDLREAVLDDRIPYIEIKAKGSSKEGQAPDLDVSLKSLRNSLAKGPHNRLVIFSHVWSDGLGNPKENALPMCQLQRFYDMLIDSPWDDVVGRQMLDTQQHDKYANKRMKAAPTFPPRSWRKWTRKQFHKPIKIWIDTLCIPLEDEARRRAIGMLKRYYSFASMTVVLDKGLSSLQHKTFTESELLLRIGLSKWMSRCWTMQEAIISGGNLMVRFDDGWFPLLEVVAFIRSQSDEIGVNVMNDSQRSRVKHWNLACKMICFPIYAVLVIMNPGQFASNFCCGLCGMCCKAMFRPLKGKPKLQPNTTSKRIMEDSKDFFSAIAKLCQSAPSTKDKAGQIANSIQRTTLSWHGLAYRNTSHAPDRFINFAFGCAKSDEEFQFMRDVMTQPSGDRLRQWYLSQPGLPTGLLFMEGPKMTQVGFRWAPVDIHPARIDSDQPATCVRKGRSHHALEGSLMVQLPGLLIDQVPRRTDGVWVLHDKQKGFSYTLQLDWNSSPSLSRTISFDQSRMAVVLSGSLSTEGPTQGAIIEHVSSDSKSYSGQFVCRVTIMPNQKADSSLQNYERIAFQRLEGRQAWTIS